MKSRPDFIIIGAMKCATSTLHEQLALQPGFFMTAPKEPNFFSNDEEYAKGLEWYASLFQAAQPQDICGESSTHYTKLPTYPNTVERIKSYCPDVKLIYVMRHPVNRLVSQYIHEWTQRVVSTEINDAIHQYPELIAYSQYTRQLKPFFEAFGYERVLPVFFEHMLSQPQVELERVCRFLGYPSAPTWQEDLEAQNVSSERLRKDPIRDFLVNAPGLKTIRKRLVPKGFRNYVKQFWTMKQRPELSAENLAKLEELFDQDLAELGSWLGIELSCRNYKDQVKSRPLEWVDVPIQTMAS
jgi:hypothetical protein